MCVSARQLFYRAGRRLSPPTHPGVPAVPLSPPAGLRVRRPAEPTAAATLPHMAAPPPAASPGNGCRRACAQGGPDPRTVRARLVTAATAPPPPQGGAGNGGLAAASSSPSLIKRGRENQPPAAREGDGAAAPGKEELRVTGGAGTAAGGPLLTSAAFVRRSAPPAGRVRHVGCVLCFTLAS